MSDYGSDAEDETEFTCANVRPPPPASTSFQFQASRSWLKRGALTSKVLRPAGSRGAPSWSTPRSPFVHLTVSDKPCLHPHPIAARGRGQVQGRRRDRQQCVPRLTDHTSRFL